MCVNVCFFLEGGGGGGHILRVVTFQDTILGKYWIIRG